jgi:hypothetical protein
MVLPLWRKESPTPRSALSNVLPVRGTLGQVKTLPKDRNRAISIQFRKTMMGRSDSLLELPLKVDRLRNHLVSWAKECTLWPESSMSSGPGHPHV